MDLDTGVPTIKTESGADAEDGGEVLYTEIDIDYQDIKEECFARYDETTRSSEISTNKKTKSRNFTIDELCNLLDIIEVTPVLTSKKTDASTNMAKNAAWSQLAEKFNADNGNIYRDVSQLKLKWDNLKKAAKKRETSINANKRAPGGGEGVKMIPDPILDRIIAMIKLLNQVGPKSSFGDDAGHVVEFSEDAGVALDAACKTAEEKIQLDERLQTSEMTPSAAVGSVVEYSHVKSPVNPKSMLTKRKTLENKLITSKIRKNNAIALYYEYKLKNKKINGCDSSV